MFDLETKMIYAETIFSEVLSEENVAELEKNLSQIDIHSCFGSMDPAMPLSVYKLMNNPALATVVYPREVNDNKAVNGWADGEEMDDTIRKILVPKDFKEVLLAIYDDESLPIQKLKAFSELVMKHKQYFDTRFTKILDAKLVEREKRSQAQFFEQRSQTRIIFRKSSIDTAIEIYRELAEEQALRKDINKVVQLLHQKHSEHALAETEYLLPWLMNNFLKQPSDKKENFLHALHDYLKKICAEKIETSEGSVPKGILFWQKHSQEMMQWWEQIKTLRLSLNAASATKLTMVQERLAFLLRYSEDQARPQRSIFPDEIWLQIIGTLINAQDYQSVGRLAITCKEMWVIFLTQLAEYEETFKSYLQIKCENKLPLDTIKTVIGIDSWFEFYVRVNQAEKAAKKVLLKGWALSQALKRDDYAFFMAATLLNWEMDKNLLKSCFEQGSKKCSIMLQGLNKLYAVAEKNSRAFKVEEIDVEDYSWKLSPLAYSLLFTNGLFWEELVSFYSPQLIQAVLTLICPGPWGTKDIYDPRFVIDVYSNDVNVNDSSMHQRDKGSVHCLVNLKEIPGDGKWGESQPQSLPVPRFKLG
jgi:hypothetical protein